MLRPGNRVELLDGRLYLDTKGTHSGSVEIVTRFGTLRDVGTQFEVLATGTTLRVRTREGAVTLTRGPNSTQCSNAPPARSCASIRTGTSSAAASRRTTRNGPGPKCSPNRHSGPDLSLLRFLDWVARETGRGLRYDSPDTETRVSRVVLHGTTPELAPVQALEVALATTDIEYSLLDDGTILLRQRQSP